MPRFLTAMTLLLAPLALAACGNSSPPQPTQVIVRTPPAPGPVVATPLAPPMVAVPSTPSP